MGLGKLIYDSAKNRVPMEYSEYSVEDREQAIREKLFEVLEISEYEKKSFRKAMRKHRVEVFEIIEEIIDNVLANGDYQKNAFYNQFVEVRNLALGDENLFYIEGEKKLEVAEFSGSHWDLKRERFDVGEAFKVSVKDYGVKVYEYAERIAAGRVDYAKIVAEVAKAVDRKMNELAQATFVKAVEKIPAAFKASGSFDEETIIEACQHVEAANGQKPILVGTRLALRKLQGITDVVSDNMIDDKNRAGLLPVWQGYACMEVAQGHKQGTLEFTMPNDKVYIVAGDARPVKLVLEGDTEVKQVADEFTNADGSVEEVVRFKAGCAVVYGGVIGEITIAS